MDEKSKGLSWGRSSNIELVLWGAAWGGELVLWDAACGGGLSEEDVSDLAFLLSEEPV